MPMLIHIQYVLQYLSIIYLLNVPSLNVKYMLIQRRNSLVLFLWMTGHLHELFYQNFYMKSYSVGSLNAMCNACLFLAIIWALYDLLSLVITFTDIFFLNELPLLIYTSIVLDFYAWCQLMISRFMQMDCYFAVK